MALARGIVPPLRGVARGPLHGGIGRGEGLRITFHHCIDSTCMRRKLDDLEGEVWEMETG